ncbi:MAG TPA: hypothetical protein VGJ79_15325, partial [Candidatus Dormibacteraeota bacterium]
LGNADIARLVLSHFGDAVMVFFVSLKENLLAGDGFVRNHQRLSDAIQATQLVYFILQLALIPLAAIALWVRRDGRLALLCVAALNVYVAGGFTFNQGDRITIIALPLWLVAFVVAIHELRSQAPRAQVADSHKSPSPATE